MHRECKRIWLQRAELHFLPLPSVAMQFYVAYLYLHQVAHVLLTLVKVAKVLATCDVCLYSSASLPRSELMWLLQYEIANFYVLLI